MRNFAFHHKFVKVFFGRKDFYLYYKDYNDRTCGCTTTDAGDCTT